MDKNKAAKNRIMRVVRRVIDRWTTCCGHEELIDKAIKAEVDLEFVVIDELERARKEGVEAAHVR